MLPDCGSGHERCLEMGHICAPGREGLGEVLMFSRTRSWGLLGSGHWSWLFHSRWITTGPGAGEDWRLPAWFFKEKITTNYPTPRDVSQSMYPCQKLPRHRWEARELGPGFVNINGSVLTQAGEELSLLSPTESQAGLGERGMNERTPPWMDVIRRSGKGPTAENSCLSINRLLTPTEGQLGAGRSGWLSGTGVTGVGQGTPGASKFPWLLRFF